MIDKTLVKTALLALPWHAAPTLTYLVSFLVHSTCAAPSSLVQIVVPDHPHVCETNFSICFLIENRLIPIPFQKFTLESNTQGIYTTSNSNNSRKQHFGMKKLLKLNSYSITTIKKHEFLSLFRIKIR